MGVWDTPKIVEQNSKTLQETVESYLSVGTLDVSVPAKQCVTANGKWFWMYHVRVAYGGSSYTVLRRFSDFQALSAKLKRDAMKGIPPFPPRHSFARQTQEFAETRRVELDEFLRRVLAQTELCSLVEL